MEPISILLVDDNPKFREITTRFIQEQVDLVVVGTASEAHHALSLSISLHPQVVLLDIGLPDVIGLDIIPDLRAALPGVQIIVLTLMDTMGYRTAALNLGADEFVSKANLNDELIPAIRRVVRAPERRQRSELSG